MIGIDTNVLVRYVVRDDESQTALADELVDRLTSERRGFISLIVLMETWWVLSSAYTFPAARRVAFVEALLSSEELMVEAADTVRKALSPVRAGADLADAVIAQVGAENGCDATMTFDRRAAQRAGMQILGRAPR
ncbi:PIN domain-containing protein [Ruania rhizosphaerae]|uniref:PIN domain-containing protein n=1 Tax=Ruania rhizosphaerae TaxID=1840413 RepID=UPI00135CA82A|nr:type II toxin-antitoxin system VapC family toxin [Ruania rhizosphaerae]